MQRLLGGRVVGHDSVLSFVLTPAPVVALETEADLRRFAGNYLTPVLRGLSPGAA